MGVQCQILITKPKEGIHRAGQPVKGKVRYVVDEPTEYKDITLSFLGKGKVRWSQGSGKSRRTYYGFEDYIVTEVNVCNKRPNETVTISGSYEHPFEFFLPEDIPRSYKDRIGSISYVVMLKFEKPSFFSINKVFTTEIPVYSYLNPTTEGPIIFGLQKELFAPFAAETPVVKLKAEAEKTFLTPGENAHISYEVTNDSDVEITAVKTELYCNTTYTADGGTKKQIKLKVESCEMETAMIPERTVFSFSNILPTLPTLYSIQNSKVIEIEYRIRVTVRLPMPHLNPSVELPVLIGEVKGALEPGTEVLEYEEPPSYWEAMNDDKKEDKTDDESE